MTNRNPLQTEAKEQRICREYLTLAARELDLATRTRIHRIMMSRQCGLTNAQIGAALGVSEAAIRGLIKRNSGAQ